MKHIQQSIPHKPGDWVYFLTDHSIMAGQVSEISITLHQVGQSICRELAEWIIEANGTKYHCSLNQIASQFETIIEVAQNQYHSFKQCAEQHGQTDPYAHIKEVF